MEVYLANVDEKSREKCMELAKQLRDFGVSVEYDVMQRPLVKQLDYVNSRGIKYAIVVGEKETKSGVVRLRNMQSGSEKEIEIRNLKRVKDIVDSE